MKDTLFIYPRDEVYLPNGYHFSHNVAVKLYDDLVWILKDEKTQKKFNTKIHFEKDGDVPSEEDEDIVEWLIEKGYKKEVDEIISKNLVLGIISDVCHFIHQALDSSKNIKLTVAFTLIRKPFLENLLILEQLLTEEQVFLEKFESDSKKFDPGKINDIKKKQLIENSLKQISNNYLLSSDLINDLRWDKKNPNSIYANANLGTHLVTTRNPSYKTERQNLNLIFSGEEEWSEQLDYFYYFVPVLLYYFTEVVDSYVLRKKIITKRKLTERKFLRLIGQLMLHDQFNEKSIKGKSALNNISKVLKVKCKNCNRINQLFKSDLFNLVSEDYILCKFCLLDLYRETESLNELMTNFLKKMTTANNA
ncbi:hypothetical protein [Tenacibaculum discolor]|uniref:hypothetical protein n=1 Tax=Tenacibaculum discolor TaxID=361581 RepID=UPI000EAFA94F|nr:hypothetical protein [Tenacibaculum discolor]RLK02243.1 hypothetical protein C8N27_1376 [Tenacibaculum discolor]